MARPVKMGLNYFPLDTTWEMNMKLVKAKFGLAGIGCIVELYRAIYHEGYCLKWDDDTKLLFSTEHDIDPKTLDEIICYSISKRIFDSKILDNYGFLTSHGIQTRWIKIVSSSGRKTEQIEPFLNLLLTDEFSKEETTPTEGFPPGETTPTDEFEREENTQSKVKESKVKESKVKESKTSDDSVFFNNFLKDEKKPESQKPQTPGRQQKREIPEESRKLFESFWEIYPKKEQEQDALYVFFQCLEDGCNSNEITIAAKNYADYCSENQIGQQYIKLPHNFLLKSRWKDWLTRESMDAFIARMRDGENYES